MTRRPELDIKSIERFSNSCSAEREAIKYLENSTKPEVDFEPNRGEIVFGIQLRQRLSHKSVKAYATMPIGIMGSKSLALLC